MKAPSFAYSKPSSLEEALELLERPGATILAGGQSLIPSLNMRLSSPELLVDITGIPGLSKIEASAKGLRIGALKTTEIGTVAFAHARHEEGHARLLSVHGKCQENTCDRDSRKFHVTSL